MIDRVITSGIFSLDGEDFEVENNVWIVGDEHEVIIIDAAHDERAIIDAVGGRQVRSIIATHGHNDHINAAGALSDATGAPILLHPEDQMLFDLVYPGRHLGGELADSMVIHVGPIDLEVLHTPGHSPGGVCLLDRDHGVVFSGDTLFKGGPGATGRSYSDEAQLLASIAAKLLVLPGSTRVLTGHGEETTIEAESDNLRQRATEPPRLPPDDKDWTWVLERPCPECHFDASSIERADLGDHFRDNAAAWRHVLEREDVTVRRRADRWSALEYACHVRDVYRIANMRIFLLQSQDDPTFANWDQDATAHDERYDLQDPAVVAHELSDAAELLAQRLDAISDDEWWRLGRRSDGCTFTIETLGLYILHDPVHHLVDVDDAPR